MKNYEYLINLPIDQFNKFLCESIGIDNVDLRANLILNWLESPVDESFFSSVVEKAYAEDQYEAKTNRAIQQLKIAQQEIDSLEDIIAQQRTIIESMNDIIQVSLFI